MHKLFLTTAAFLLAGLAQANTITAPPALNNTTLDLRVEHGITDSPADETIAPNRLTSQSFLSEGNLPAGTTSGQNVPDAAAVATPEPVTFLLFGSAILGLSLMRRRVQYCVARSSRP